MNAIVSIETLTPATVFVPGGVEAIISKVEAEVRAIDRDISTPEGREAVKSLAYKVARSKTALDDMGKDLVAGIKKQAATIDAERRIIRDRLDALKDEVRGPLTAWESAEADRIALHESALVFLAEAARFASPPSAATIRERMESVRAACERDWQEFHERADAAAGDARAALGVLLATAEQAERDQAELAELRKMRAEREEADRRAAIEAEKAEREVAEVAARAEEAARRKAEAEEREKQTAARIEHEREEAARQAVERENKRIAEVHAKAEADRIKRENNQRHRAKVHKEITVALSEVLSGNAAEAAALIEAIAAGKVPHVSITY